MVKIGKMLNLENETLIKIKKLDPSFNLSEKVREYLNNYLAFISSSSLGYDVIKLQKNKDKLETKLTEVSAELNQINEQITFIQKKTEEEEEEQLEKEKEIADKLVTCIVCGIPKSEEKLHNFPKGVVCHACYMTADSKTLKKYMSDKKSKLGDLRNGQTDNTSHANRGKKKG